MARSGRVRFVTLENIYGEAFRLYFKNIINLSMPVIPPFVLLGVFFYRYLLYISDRAQSGSFDTKSIMIYFGLIVLSILVLYPAIFMVIRTASNAYADIEESPGEIFALSVRRLFPFIGFNLLFGLGIMGGALLLIIPAYIIMFGWSVAHVVYVAEGGKAAASLKRSWNLTKGFKGRIFLFFLMAAAAIYFFFIVLFIILGLVAAGIAGGLSHFQGPGSLNGLYMGITAVIMILYMLIYPLFITIVTVVYYNLRKEKEGFETEQLADSFMETP